MPFEQVFIGHSVRVQNLKGGFFANSTESEYKIYLNILVFHSNGNPVICWATTKRENLQKIV
jgi:hypothetical protein